MVTITITSRVDATISDTVVNGSDATQNGWSRSSFNWTDSTRKAAAWTGSRQVSAGQTVPMPLVSYSLRATSFGISTVTVTVPAPATAVSPAPVPFLAYTGAAARTAPSSERQGSFDQ